MLNEISLFLRKTKTKELAYRENVNNKSELFEQVHVLYRWFTLIIAVPHTRAGTLIFLNRITRLVPSVLLVRIYYL